MLTNFDLGQLLLFPVKDNESRKYFLIGTLVYFASFIIPILPLIVAIGYLARIMRQAFNGEAPRMVAWDNWEEMFKDGAYLFGVRLAYTLPLIAFMLPLYFGLMFLPFWLESNRGAEEQIFAVLFPLMGIFMLLFFPLSLALGIILPAAEAHTAANREFLAGFRIREWSAIFRANWTGFLLAYLISYFASFGLMFIVMFAMITIILFCVLPFIMPAISMYLMLVMYAAFAQAYKAGKDRLLTNSPQPIANKQ